MPLSNTLTEREASVFSSLSAKHEQPSLFRETPVRPLMPLDELKFTAQGLPLIAEEYLKRVPPEMVKKSPEKVMPMVRSLLGWQKTIFGCIFCIAQNEHQYELFFPNNLDILGMTEEEEA